MATVMAGKKSGLPQPARSNPKSTKSTAPQPAPQPAPHSTRPLPATKKYSYRSPLEKKVSSLEKELAKQQKNLEEGDTSRQALEAELKSCQGLNSELKENVTQLLEEKHTVQKKLDGCLQALNDNNVDPVSLKTIEMDNEMISRKSNDARTASLSLIEKVKQQTQNNYGFVDNITQLLMMVDQTGGGAISTTEQ